MRRRFAAVLSPFSKSTKTSDDHSRRWSSSRLTTSPGRSTSVCNTCSGFPCNRTLTPCFRSSPVRTSSSKTPNRRILRALGALLADTVDFDRHRQEQGDWSYFHITRRAHFSTCGPIISALALDDPRSWTREFTSTPVDTGRGTSRTERPVVQPLAARDDDLIDGEPILARLDANRM